MLLYLRCMKYFVFTFLLAAGGMPLKEANKIYRDALDIKLVFDGIQEPYDPEYQAILDDYDRRKESFKLSHRDLQWHTVAKVMRDIDDVEERLELINTTHSYPLWRMLPATIAITPRALYNWNTARHLFLKALRK